MINLQNPSNAAAAAAPSELMFVEGPQSSPRSTSSSSPPTTVRSSLVPHRIGNSGSIPPELLDPSEEISHPVAAAAIPSFLKAAKHPFVCMFHLLWKLCAFTTYELGYFLFGLFSGENDFVFSFVLTTVFLSLDFWTVKNVTGRILVGMRWWNDIKEDGGSEWVYESAQDERIINPTDRRVFWIGIYIWPVLWCILALLEIIKFEPTWVRNDKPERRRRQEVSETNKKRERSAKKRPEDEESCKNMVLNIFCSLFKGFDMIFCAFFHLCFFNFFMLLVLCLIGVVLAGANSLGYWKCSKDQKRRVSEWASSTAMRAVFTRFGMSG